MPSCTIPRHDARRACCKVVDAAIAAGWQTAVCSTSNEKAVQAVVDKLLDGKIKHIFAGDMVPKKKPDPAIYNMAAQELSLDPNHCVVVEDSRIGLLAARAAGMAVGRGCGGRRQGGPVRPPQRVCFGIRGRPISALCCRNGLQVLVIPAPRGTTSGRGGVGYWKVGRGGGSGNQKFVYEKRPYKIFPTVNFLF